MTPEELASEIVDQGRDVVGNGKPRWVAFDRQSLHEMILTAFNEAIQHNGRPVRGVVTGGKETKKEGTL